ncbi:MAG: ABC transporter ATP-binding protein [Pseudomonadota bacterium]
MTAVAAPSAASAAEVRFEGVTKRYGEVTAVDAIDLTVPAGELLTLLGPSGCGKTTTLRLIAGLELASDGTVFIGGKDVTLLSAAQRNISMVFQSYALFPHLTVAENVGYGLKVSGMPKRAALERARGALEQVGLTGMDARLPSELSGGQQQRVAVARALVLEPEVLLFDEPLSNLDAKLRRQVRQDIRDLQQRLGITTVYVTHDQEEALAVSDRIVVMDHGRIAQIGTPRDLYERPANAFVATFIGDARLVEGRITSIEGDLATLEIGPAVIQKTLAGANQGAVDVALRPEALFIAGGTAPSNGIPGKVISTSYLGSVAEVVARTELGDLLLQIDPDAMPEMGAQIEVGITPSKVALVG